MAGKSQVQRQLDDLEKLFSNYVAHVDNLSQNVQECKSALSVLRHDLGDVRTNVVILSRDLDELRRSVEEMKRTREEAGKQWWMLVPPILGAIASVALSALITYLMNRK